MAGALRDFVRIFGTHGSHSGTLVHQAENRPQASARPAVLLNKSWGSKIEILEYARRRVLYLVSRGRCGREIARLRRLAAVVSASFLRF